MNKYIVSFIAGVSFVGGAAFADSLTELKGLENVGSGSSQHSPSQVVILNHTPSQSQDQKTESLNSASQKYKARSGWGNGESLEALRESRINKEAKNEQVLMEKLETSRMEDEKSRLRRLFKIREYNRKRQVEMSEDDYEFGSAESDYEAETTYAPVRKTTRVVNLVEAPSIQLAAAPIVADTPVSYSAGTSSTSVTNSFGARPYYIKGQLGLGKYHSAENSTTPLGTASWGLAVGKDVNKMWQFEVGVYKTSYEINDPGAAVVQSFDFNGFAVNSQNRSLDQYNFSGLLGFKLINSSKFLGTLRGGLSYVRRDSESSDIAGLQPFRSNTIDGLMGVGVDVEVGNNMMVAVSADYYTNILNDIASTNSQAVERVETSDYYVLGLGLKFKF